MTNVLKTLSYLIEIEKKLAECEMSAILLLEQDPSIENLSHYEEKWLETSLNEFDFPIRVNHVLEDANLKTIKDVLHYGLNNLLKMKNFGTESFKEFITIIDQSYQPEAIGTPRNECNKTKNYAKSETMQMTFLNDIALNVDNCILKTSLDEFIFSPRVSSALSRHKLKTIGDVLNFGWGNIYRIKNIGRKSAIELKNTIEHFLQKSQTEIISKENKQDIFSDNANAKICFTSFIEDIFPSFLTEKQLQIIKARYGYGDGKKKTLDQIGGNLNVTRERIRQIIVDSLKQLKHPLRKKYFQDILEHIEHSLLHNNGVVSVNDLSTSNFFFTGNKNQLRFLLNLLADLYEERYRIIEKTFLSTLTDEELKELNTTIDEAALKCHFPIYENDFHEEIITVIGKISRDYLSHYLIYKKHVEISDGTVLTPGRLSIPQKIKLIMQDVDTPMHFTEIAKLYTEYFGENKNKTSNIGRAIHTRIGNVKDFIIVGPGAFLLRNKFIVPDNVNEIMESSKEILRSVNNISDTKYLIEKLKQRQIHIGSLNPYSLKTILLEYPGFVKYRRFEIGIEELSNQYERRSLSDLIYEFLLDTGKPLHSKEIWKQISNQRGFPRYAIDQRLYREPQFIKIAPSTYTVKENISTYEIKYASIVNFAKEWITLKGDAVSAFFVTEVIKATEDIKDLTIGFVEHVLATSPEFNKVSNGFYELAVK